MICADCGIEIEQEDWEIIKVDRFSDIVPLCDSCFEGECFWWDAYFQENPEEVEIEIMLGIV